MLNLSTLTEDDFRLIADALNLHATKLWDEHHNDELDATDPYSIQQLPYYSSVGDDAARCEALAGIFSTGVPNYKFHISD